VGIHAGGLLSNSYISKFSFTSSEWSHAALGRYNARCYDVVLYSSLLGSQNWALVLLSDDALRIFRSVNTTCDKLWSQIFSVFLSGYDGHHMKGTKPYKSAYFLKVMISKQWRYGYGVVSN
jgi:hypothetical protein